MLAEAERGHSGQSTVPAESLTTQGDRTSKRLFKPRSFLEDPYVRLLLLTYGLYTVGEIAGAHQRGADVPDYQ